MTAARESRGDFGELAGLLARGYLRLTEKAQFRAVSDPSQPQKELDVSTTESPHVVGDASPRRA